MGDGEPTANGPLVRDFDEFLKQLDVITFHVPGTPETKHLINATRLNNGTCRPNLLIVNDARGEVIDEHVRTLRKLQQKYRDRPMSLADACIVRMAEIHERHCVLTLDSDQARERYQKIRARFAQSPPELDLKGALRVRRYGRELELIANGAGPELMERLRQHNPEALSTEALTLEEIFVATLKS